MSDDHHSPHEPVPAEGEGFSTPFAYRPNADVSDDLQGDLEVESGHQAQHVRWWTTLAIPALSLGFFLFTSMSMLVVAMIVVLGGFELAMMRDPKAMNMISSSRIGLLLIVVVPQIALVAPSVIAAMLSSKPTAERLGLRMGHWPVWGWLAAALATPLVGLVSSLVIGMFMEESENLKMMSEIFREHGKSGFLIPLALMIGATPAICEELVFRGYVQTRLVRTAGPAIGILVSSFLFAVFHMDLVHIIAVFPLGLFLGFVTWRSGSLFPAMFGHFLNNVISVVAVVLAPQGETDVFSAPSAMISLSILGGGIIGLVAVVACSVKYGGPSDSSGAAEISELANSEADAFLIR